MTEKNINFKAISLENEALRQRVAELEERIREMKQQMAEEAHLKGCDDMQQIMSDYLTRSRGKSTVKRESIRNTCNEILDGSNIVPNERLRDQLDGFDDDTHYTEPKPQVQHTVGQLPEKLNTRAAQRIWRALQQTGIVDHQYALNERSLSRQAIVAQEFSRRLFPAQDIHWALFEQLWGVRNLRSQGNHLPKFRQQVKEIISAATGKIKL